MGGNCCASRKGKRKTEKGKTTTCYFNPNAYTMVFLVVTYTLPSATVMLLRCVQSSIVSLLEYNSCPVSASSAYRIVCVVFWPRSSAVIVPVFGSGGSPGF